MPDSTLTLLELTKRSNMDLAVGLVQEINTVAPELTDLTGRAVTGIAYTIHKQVTLPGTSGSMFRNANEGSLLASGKVERSMGSCYFLDIPLQVDEAIVRSGAAEGMSPAEVLAQEATSAFRNAIIGVGDQFYRGTTADTKGFAGLQAQYDATNCEVSAGGVSGSASSAYLIWNDPQGVHWVFGRGQGLITGDWMRQKVTDANSKHFFAYVNNVSGYLGLSVAHSRSIVRIKLLTTAAPLTDNLVATAIAKLPIFMRRSPNLRLLCNSQAQLQLQKSRSATTAQDNPGSKRADSLNFFAPPPTESNGVPIILTDSLPNNE